jgi:hypothetical protein
VMNMSRRLLPSSAFYTPAAESTAGPLDSTHSTAGARIGSRLGPPLVQGPPCGASTHACIHGAPGRARNVTSAATGACSTWSCPVLWPSLLGTHLCTYRVWVKRSAAKASVHTAAGVAASIHLTPPPA